MARTIRRALLAIFAANVAASAWAADDPPIPPEGPWRVILRNQLKAEKACDLNDVLIYHEIPLGEGGALDGRISCIDGREFNFSRQRAHQKFSIELCQPSVC